MGFFLRLFWNFSLVGFNSAVIFEQFEDDIIDKKIEYMEEQMKNKYSKQLKDEGEDFQLKYSKFFFGSYAKQHELFEFNDGERMLIRIIMNTVKKNIVANGLSHYQKMKIASKSIWPKELTKTPWGFFYGFLSSDLQNRSFDLDKLTDQTFTKAKNILIKLKAGIKTEEIRGFQKKSIDITKTEGGKLKGSVQCCYCDTNIKLSCQLIKDTAYFSPSNFEAHLLKHVKNSAHEQKLKSSELEYISPTHNQDQAEVRNEKSPIHGQNSSMISLTIEPAVVNSTVEDSENILYSQLSKQNLVMTNVTAKNQENIESFISSKGPKSKRLSTVKMCRIQADNSCLFGSVVHQLYGTKINSAEHSTSVDVLRKNVVEHIIKRMPEYFFILKDRVFSKSENKSIEDITRDCEYFVRENLSQTSCWGGTETLKAISEIFRVNIVIVNDDGSSNFSNSFNIANDRTIALAFRNTDGQIKPSNISRNHYDSIAEIENVMIEMIANHLAETEIQHLKFIKDLENEEIIIDLDSASQI